MRATPTTMPRYVLVEEQLLKDTWTLYTWNFANSKCGGGMWVPQCKFPSQLISFPGIGVCPRILLYKKRWKKWEELPWWQHYLHQQNAVVSTLDVLLLTLNKALPGGRPRITRFVLILIPCLNNAQSCFVLPLSILVRSVLNVCHETHS